MRSLAIARLRLLETVRSVDWLFGISIVSALLPLSMGPALWTFGTDQVWDDVRMLRLQSNLFFGAWVLHLCILVVAGDVLGRRVRSLEEEQSVDPLDAAPVDDTSRFWGEVAGILGVQLMIHAVTLPLLVLAAALAPFSVRSIVLAETIVMALLVLFAIVEASGLRLRGSRWERSRSSRVLGIAALLALGALAATTRLRAFVDAFVWFADGPSPRALRALLQTIHNPLLLSILLASIYVGTIAYLHLLMVRSSAER